jgi:hypothetical protein
LTPAYLRRLHQRLLEIDVIEGISVETEWRELAHKLPPKKRQS